MKVQELAVSVYRIPTDRPEADGTIAWDATTLVLVQATAVSGQHGLGFVYADAAGEYGYDPWYFRRMLRAEAVDILQADATRCLGFTGWLIAADLAYSFDIPFSAYTAPSLHAQVGCAAPQIAHVEYFYDHVRIENMLFEGVLHPVAGCLQPDPNRLGVGLVFKHQDAEQWRIN